MAGLIKTSSVTGSGYFTVGGAGKFEADSVTAKDGWKVAATASNIAKTITQTALATVGIVGEEDGWTITLGTTATESARSASVKGSSNVYGTKLADAVSIGGTYVTLDLGAGDDSVVGTGAGYANINLGAGSDSVALAGNNVIVTAGDGADYVSINGTNANITGGAGADSIFAGASSFIDAGDGNDVVSVGGNNVTVYGGAGADSIMATGEGSLIYGDAGNDTVSVGGSKATIYGGAGKDSILVAASESYVDAGDDNDIVSIGGASVTAAGGAGKDSIVVAGESATITLGDGKDTVSIGAKGATLTDYSYTDDTIVLGDNQGKTDPSRIKLTDDGMISVTAGGADVTVNTTDGYYKAKLSGGQSYAWATKSSTTIDLSAETKPFYVVTNDNEVGDVVTGGRGDDSILVGKDDTVNGGRGDDSISIAADATGVVVGLSANGGNDSIVGASVTSSDILGFDDDDLTIQTDSAVTGYEVKDGHLKLSTKDASITFADALDTTNAVDVKVNNSGTLVKTEFVTGKYAGIDEDAWLIYGDNKNDHRALKLEGTDNYTVDLGYTGKYGDTRAYIGIDSVNASEGEGTYVLVGGSNGSTLQGGKTETSLIGAGSGADSLVGGTGVDTFYYGAGSGKDTISGYDEANDKLVFTSSAITGWEKTSKDKNLVYTFEGTDQTLTIQDAGKGENTKYNYSIEGVGTGVSKIGYTDAANNFEYASDVTLYQGGDKTDKLVVKEDDAQVWLDGQDAARTYASIEYVDASQAKGDIILVGGTANETLVGGTGNTLMFGGFGDNDDVLVGSRQGETTFYFAKGCGNDTITASGSSDRILLYGITLDDFDSTKSSGGTDLVIGLKDGSTLTVKGVASGVKTVVLGTSVDTGETWTYDAAKSTFSKAE